MNAEVLVVFYLLIPKPGVDSQLDGATYAKGFYPSGVAASHPVCGTIKQNLHPNLSLSGYYRTNLLTTCNASVCRLLARFSPCYYIPVYRRAGGYPCASVPPSAPWSPSRVLQRVDAPRVAVQRVRSIPVNTPPECR
ncbi:hypothetical protein GQ600_1738 [Phytophthora cactorum]|nr:hypothetical protein GQ600_1738 [Phytophthora cactorum]